MAAVIFLSRFEDIEKTCMKGKEGGEWVGENGLQSLHAREVVWACLYWSIVTVLYKSFAFVTTIK